MVAFGVLFRWFGNKIFIIMASGVAFMLIQAWMAKRIVESNSFAVVSVILFIVAIIYGRMIK